MDIEKEQRGQKIISAAIIVVLIWLLVSFFAYLALTVFV